MIKLYIIRHGETDWNVVKKMQGMVNNPLSDAGILQSEKLSKRLVSVKFNEIVSSQLKRAMQTAEIVARPHGLKIDTDPLLNEMNFGVFEGKSIEEIEKDPELSKLWKARESDFYNYQVPGGESIKEVFARVELFLEKLLFRVKKGNIAIVSHGITKIVLVTILKNLPRDKIKHVWYHNTGLSIFEIKDKEVKEILFNCAKHLQKDL